MDEDPILMIHNGRHLLHELCVQQYITNDTMLSGGGEDAEYSSMVSAAVRDTLTTDDRYWSERVGEVCIRQAGSHHRLHGADWQLRSCRKRQNRAMRQE